MQDETIPSWAQTLIREVTILNERLPNHVDWTERNIKDHENRIRFIERWLWIFLGAASAVGGVIGSMLTNIINN